MEEEVNCWSYNLNTLCMHAHVTQILFVQEQHAYIHSATDMLT